MAIQDALAGGWTSISEMLLMADGLDDLRSLDDEGQLRLRVNAYLAPYPPGIPDEERFGIWFTDYEPRQTVSPRLRIGGVKLFADSYAPAAPLHMLLTEAYADRPGYLGDAFWEPDAFLDFVRTLHDDGWQVATHTLGDAAHEFVLDAYEAALAGADNDRYRHRIEHAFVIRDDQVARMRDLAVIASIQLPLMSADWAADWEAALGPERLAWAGRWRDLLEAGVPMVGGTDFPAVLSQRDCWPVERDARLVGWGDEDRGRGRGRTRLDDGPGAHGRAGPRSPDPGGRLRDLRGGPEGHDHGREAGGPGDS